MTELRGANI